MAEDPTIHEQITLSIDENLKFEVDKGNRVLDQRLLGQRCADRYVMRKN